MKFYSHKEKLLIAHLEEVSENVKKIDSDNKLLDIIAKTHDFGKCTSFFQDRLFARTKVYTDKANHSYISALFTYYILQERTFSAEDCIVAYMCVYSHHSYARKIEDMFRIEPSKSKVLEEQLEDMLKYKDEIEKIYKELDIDFSLEEFKDWLLGGDEGALSIIKHLRRIYRKEIRKNIERYHSRFLKALTKLVYADRYSAANTSIELKRNFIEAEDVKDYISYLDKPSPLNDVRNWMREETIKNLRSSDIEKTHFFFINGFTGSGKSLTSLTSALALKEKKEILTNKPVKIVYGLPFVNIVMQIYDEFKAITENYIEPNDFRYNETHYIMKHFYLADSIYTSEGRDGSTPIEDKLLLDNFESNLIITTFVQLFNTFYTNRNSNLSKLAGLNNAIIVFDEVQNFPVEYWTLIEEVLKFWAKELNLHFILMTATKPIIFEDESFVLIEAGFNMLSKPRTRLFYDPIPQGISEFIDRFIKDDYLQNGAENYLIICNTIDSSKEVFITLKAHLKDSIIYYISNNITSIEKEKRLKCAKEDLLRGKRVIVVSTQVIEAGVDISFDRIYSDIASLDSILQRAGRANRNGLDSPSDVFVVTLMSEYGEGYTYGRFIYGNIHINVTQKILSSALGGRDYITDKDNFDNLIKDYFTEIKKSFNAVMEDNKGVLWDAFLNLDGYKMKEFSLIENAKQSTYFIEINEEAQHVYNQYKERVVNEKDYKTRQNEFLKIRKNLNKYIVNIYQNKEEKLQIANFQNEINEHSKDKWGNIASIRSIPFEVIKEVYDTGHSIIDRGSSICFDGVGLL